MRMDASDLRIFEGVARLGGMSRAANELNTVQSNITARIKLLEDELGVSLFTRHSRGVSLTPAGRRLLPYASRIQHVLLEAAHAVREDGTPKGQLLLGSLETTAAVRLSPVIAAYLSDYPAVDFVLTTGTSCELIDQVLDRQLDGALVCGPVNHAELETEFFTREELVVLTAQSLISFDSLARQNDLKIIVLKSGCTYRQHLEILLANRGIVNFRSLEFGTLEAIIGCVSAGLGITLLPKSLAGTVWRPEQVAVHELPLAEAEVETVFIRRRDSFVSSALVEFLQYARLTNDHVQAAK
jgi:DNA-binding transcriptional LysR family regulator